MCPLAEATTAVTNGGETLPLPRTFRWKKPERRMNEKGRAGTNVALKKKASAPFWRKPNTGNVVVWPPRWGVRKLSRTPRGDVNEQGPVACLATGP